MLKVDNTRDKMKTKKQQQPHTHTQVRARVGATFDDVKKYRNVNFKQIKVISFGGGGVCVFV